MAALLLPLVILSVLLAPAHVLAHEGAHAADLPKLESFPNSAVLKEGDFYLYWRVVEDGIEMALKARTSGWVALGFSEVGAMVGSDVMVGWVANGSAVITDRFIFNKSVAGVPLDASQDVEMDGGTETYDYATQDTWTILHVHKANSSDCNDRQISPGQHVAVIWAMGSTDEFAYHGATSRGMSVLTLIPGSLYSALGPQTVPDGATVKAADATASRSLVSDAAPARNLREQMVQSSVPLHESNLYRGAFRRVQVVGAPPPGGDVALPQASQDDTWINITAPGYNVPAITTMYACNAFEIKLPSKRHVVEYGVILNSTHPESVHHFVVFSCMDPTDTPRVDANYECFSSGGCSKEFAVWAVGGRPVMLPPAAGLPVGPGGVTKLVLQVHYTNPDLRTDIVDSSGLYMRISETLRPNDADIMSLGPVFIQAMIRVPPQQSAWTLDTYCPAACTDILTNMTAGKNVTVINTLLHLHTAGKQLYTELYREGQMVASVGRQDYYDFNYQQGQDLSPGLVILPGDELRTRCVWDTTGRTNVTRGGFSTSDEMCINYLLYYPATPMVRVSCFNLCLFAPNNFTIGAPRGNDSNAVNCTLTPQLCSFQSFISCASGIYLKGNDTCDPLTVFGTSATAFAPLSGCMNSTVAVADITTLDLTMQTKPAAEGEAPPTIDPRCVAPAPMGMNSASSNSSVATVGYTQCTELSGGFMLMWNVTTPESAGETASKMSVTGGNVSLVVRFSGTAPTDTGFIAFGFSPSGGMVGSSVVAGWPTGEVASGGNMSAGAATPLYLGGKSPAAVTPGNSLLVTDEAVEVSGTNITIYATISVPATTAVSVQNVIWAKGMTAGSGLAGHASSDAHQGTLLALNCTATPGFCDSMVPPSTTSPPPKGGSKSCFPSVLLVAMFTLLAL